MIRPGVKPIFRLALRRRDIIDGDVDEEIALHLEMRAAQLEAEGLSAPEARRAALQRFGAGADHQPTLRKAAHRRETHLRVREWLDGVRQDVRVALRSLARDPVSTSVMILSMAFGIGANATMFRVVDALMFRSPAHVVRPDQVVRIYFDEHMLSGGVAPGRSTGYATYEALRDHAHGFQEIAAYWPDKTFIGHGNSAQPVNAVLVTPSFFRTLGTRPTLGRFLAPDVEPARQTNAVVLGYRLWEDRFGGNTGVLGRHIYVNGHPYTVVGVAPRSFTGVDFQRVDVWLPMAAAVQMFAPNALSRAPNVWLRTIARLEPGVSSAAAAAGATAALAGASGPAGPANGSTVLLAPLPLGRSPRMASSSQISLWLGTLSLVVLLIACANVANLLLGRAVSRSREIAILVSLGAGRWRVGRQIIVESLVLVTCGGAGAVLLSAWSSAFLRRVVFPDTPIGARAISLRMFLFLGGMALGAGLLCGLVPALVATRSPFDAVRRGRHRATSSRSAVQRTLAVSQVAFTVVLVAEAGLFVRSLRNAWADVGMDVGHLLYASVDFASAGASPAHELSRYGEMLRRVRSVPGVTAASISIGEPFGGGWGVAILPTTGLAAQVHPPPIAASGRAVSAGFFTSTRRRFVTGRSFTAAEHSPSARVAIINESAARYYWGDDSAVGACIRPGPAVDGCLTVIGIVADAPNWQAGAVPRMELYVPIEALPYHGQTLRVNAMEIRSIGGPSTIIDPVRHAMESVGSDIPYPSVELLTDVIDPLYRKWIVGAEVLSAFGVLALVLGAAGVYGVIAYTVAQRMPELGIRAALGAEPSTLVRSIVRRGLATSLIGALIGVGVVLGAGRFIGSFLYRVSPDDPASLAAAVTIVLAVAALASYLPARRAGASDPMTALRID